jgi:hypothetical protein
VGDMSDDARENELFQNTFGRLRFFRGDDGGLHPTLTKETEVSAKETQIEALLRQVEANLKTIRDLEAEPDDDFPDGAIVTWRNSFGGLRAYTYVAIKIEAAGPTDHWFVAGKIGWTTWSQLLRHLQRADEGTAWWATQLTELQL